jgi:hypothetical protein
VNEKVKTGRMRIKKKKKKRKEKVKSVTVLWRLLCFGRGVGVAGTRFVIKNPPNFGETRRFFLDGKFVFAIVL